jgi:hypothetical protein
MRFVFERAVQVESVVAQLQGLEWGPEMAKIQLERSHIR